MSHLLIVVGSRPVMVDSAELATVQAALLAAVAELVQPTRFEALSGPCLLDQLAEALEPSSSHGGAGRNRQSAPLALDVVILLAEIDRELYRGLVGTKTTPRARPALMRAWAARSGHWRATDPDYLLYAASSAARWLTRTSEILSVHPATREPYGAPCPHCHTTVVFVASPEGDQRVQRSALYLDTERVAVACRACGDDWPTDHLEFLATLLADQVLTNGSKPESLTPHR
jgi:hypothetical protein